MESTMMVPPIDRSELVEISSAQDLFEAPKTSIYRWQKLPGTRSELDRLEVEANFISVEKAQVVVGDRDIFYLTSDGRYLPQLYPKPWPYAKYFVPRSQMLSIDLDHLSKRRLPGTFFMPFTVAGNWFHILFDNYARLFFLDKVPGAAGLPIGIPFWGLPGPSAIDADREWVHSRFLSGHEVVRLEKGIYEIDRLIAPPLANVDDYFLVEPVRFVAEKLSESLSPKTAQHALRLFVSRADISARNLSNESEFAGELRRLGFTILCPGDYLFQTQLDLFAAAEIIVGVHGQGLTPMISAGRCQTLMEFEAADWKFTAYRSLADVLGIAYAKLPCELIQYRNPARFDWIARADIPASIAMIEEALRALDHRNDGDGKSLLLEDAQ
jgi:hypothetical protein